MLTSSFYVFVGGGLGAVVRFLLSQAAIGLTRSGHWGTLAVNVIGAGTLYFLNKKGVIISKNMDTGIKVGLLGGLTTFSTFSYEVFAFIQQQKYAMALGHFGLNIVFGIIVLIIVFR